MAASHFLWNPYSSYSTFAERDSIVPTTIIDDPAAYEQLVEGMERRQQENIILVDTVHAQNGLPTGMRGLIDLLVFQMKPYAWFDADANARQLEVRDLHNRLRVETADGRLLVHRDSNGEVDRFRVRRDPETTAEYWTDEGNLEIQYWGAAGR